MTKAYELKNPQQIEEVRSRMLSAEKIRQYKIKRTPMRVGESSNASWKKTIDDTGLSRALRDENHTTLMANSEVSRLLKKRAEFVNSTCDEALQ